MPKKPSKGWTKQSSPWTVWGTKKGCHRRGTPYRQQRMNRRYLLTTNLKLIFHFHDFTYFRQQIPFQFPFDLVLVNKPHR